MQHSQTSYVSKAYTEVAHINDEKPQQLTKKIEPLDQYITQIRDFVGQFNQVHDTADELLNKDQKQFALLLDSVLIAEFGQNNKLLKQFNDFIEKLV